MKATFEIRYGFFPDKVSSITATGSEDDLIKVHADFLKQFEKFKSHVTIKLTKLEDE